MKNMIATVKMMVKNGANLLKGEMQDFDNTMFYNGEEDDFSIDFDHDDLVDMYHWLYACDRKPSLMFC